MSSEKKKLRTRPGPRVREESGFFRFLLRKGRIEDKDRRRERLSQTSHGRQLHPQAQRRDLSYEEHLCAPASDLELLEKKGNGRLREKVLPRSALEKEVSVQQGKRREHQKVSRRGGESFSSNWGVRGCQSGGRDPAKLKCLRDSVPQLKNRISEKKHLNSGGEKKKA